MLFAVIISDPCGSAEPWAYISDWMTGRDLLGDVVRSLRRAGLSWWDVLNIIEKVKASISNACRSEYEEVTWKGYHIEIHEREVVKNVVSH